MSPAALRAEREARGAASVAAPPPAFRVGFVVRIEVRAKDGTVVRTIDTPHQIAVPRSASCSDSFSSRMILTYGGQSVSADINVVLDPPAGKHQVITVPMSIEPRKVTVTNVQRDPASPHTFSAHNEEY